MNFYNTLLVILTIDCGEFNQGLRSDWLIEADFINPLGPDKLKSELWHILRQQIVIDFIKAFDRNQTIIMSLDWLYTIRMFFRANSSPFSGL